MALHLVTGNRLEMLAELLARLIADRPLPPLHTEIVVVQSRGMQRWLQMELARLNGVCANVAFPFPRSFVYRLFHAALDVPDTSPFTKEVLTWAIMGLLPTLIQEPCFEPVRGYLQDPDAALKSFQLAEKTAALFDRYLIYRPDMIRAWDRRDAAHNPPSEHARWQVRLWQAVSRVLADDSPCTQPAALQERFFEVMRGSPALRAIPGRVCVFGISSLPPYYIDILRALALHRDVHLFHLNPCCELWQYTSSEQELLRQLPDDLSADDLHLETGNSLLAAMGTSGREFFTLLMDALDEEGTQCFEEPEGTSMLAQVQSDILHLRDPADPGMSGRTPDPQDRSIQMHSCHSPMREVEVMQDVLLELFRVNPGLLPRDVAVMMPDVSRYAPLIQSVLNAPGEDGRRIPYSIADRSVRAGSTIAAAFLAILGVEEQRFKTGHVLEILSQEAVYRTFGLQEHDLETVHTWVRDSGICWGIDAENRRRLGLPAFQEHTWRFGLDRLLLGYAMGPDTGTATFREMLPCSGISPADADVLGALATFFDTLQETALQLHRDRTPAQWSAFLCTLLERFFAAAEHTSADLQEIRDALTENGLQGQAAAAGFNGQVPLTVIRRYLRDRLENTLHPHGFISTGVTFCTMLPMRSIPFSVVYLMGMNDDAYPRTSRQLGFDLMQCRRRLCDPSRRFEDRYLFLEAVLSARTALIISYVGQSIRDNADIPPSVLVSQLRDYLGRAFGAQALSHVVTHHPLQPFSPRYFCGSGSLYSYSVENCRAVEALLEKRYARSPFFPAPLPPPAPEAAADVAIGQMCAFFRNPCAWLVRNRLNACLAIDEVEDIPEREPFALDGLQRYQLRGELTAHLLGGAPPQACLNAVRAAGLLPHGHSGETLFAEQFQCVTALVQKLTAVRSGGACDPVALALRLDRAGICLTGHLRDLYPAGQVLFRPARLRPADLLQGWLLHLAACVAAPGRPTLLLGLEERAGWEPIEPEAALQELTELGTIMVAGMQAPLCFFSATSHAFARALQEGKSEDAALKAARIVWEGRYSWQAERDDTYVRACFGEELPDAPEFGSLARAVYGPLLAARQETFPVQEERAG